MNDSKHCLKLILQFVLLILLVLIVISCIYKTESKYIRFSSPSCHRGVLNLFKENSQICCYNNIKNVISNNVVCSHAYDKLNKYVTSQWSYLIALVPLFFTSFSEILSNTFCFKLSVRRLTLYLIIFILRVVRLVLEFNNTLT